ncbi:MAG TPA: c-type cytochrome [Gemmatimonadota bacterium]|nr:c-type cytochrome [Gemmatimonadota bacterium]
MRSVLQALILFSFVLTAVFCGGGEQDGLQPAGEDGPGGSDTTAVSEPSDAPPRDSGGVSGQAVFAANCATCHGEGGRGDGPAATGLEPPPADLTDGTWTTGDGSLQAITNTIEHGSPGTAMIGWKGTLTDAEIAAVAAWVQELGR